jgi:hypothetical protein
VADIADAAKAAGFFPNRFPGRSASGVKVPSGDGFAKKNPASGQYETFTTADVRKLLGL